MKSKFSLKLTAFATSLVLIILITSCKKDGFSNGGTNTYDCVNVSGTISANLTWQHTAGASVDYIVNCELNITGGILNILPGTIIQFGPNGGIVTSDHGGITALGTSSAPILFKGATAGKGTWEGLFFASSFNNQLRYCTIDGAGGALLNTYVTQAVAIGVGGNSGSSTGVLQMQNCTITNSRAYGLWVEARNNQLQNFSSNNFQNCNLAPIAMPFALVGQLDSSSIYNTSTLSQPYIQLYASAASDVVGDMTILNSGIKYRVHCDGVYMVGVGATLTIAPGVTMEFEGNGGLQVGYNSTGTLIANGTASAPITFKGTTTGQGSWIGVSILLNTNNQLSYCTIDGGGASKPNLSDGQGCLVLGSFTDAGRCATNNCTFTNSLTWAVDKKPASTWSESNNVYNNNANSPDVHNY